MSFSHPQLRSASRPISSSERDIPVNASPMDNRLELGERIPTQKLGGSAKWRSRAGRARKFAFTPHLHRLFNGPWLAGFIGIRFDGLRLRVDRLGLDGLGLDGLELDGLELLGLQRSHPIRYIDMPVATLGTTGAAVAFEPIVSRQEITNSALE